MHVELIKILFWLPEYTRSDLWFIKIIGIVDTPLWTVMGNPRARSD